MKYLRFLIDGRSAYGVARGTTISEITPHFFGPFKETGRTVPLAKARLLPPCLPGKIVALGLNYRDHALEMNMPLPSQPLVFLKAPSAIIGPEDRIVRPAMSRRLEYEGEMAIVIGKKAKNIPAGRARDYVLGFSCFNDVTARDLQKTDGQWARAKSFDTFAPLGPWIVDDVNPDRLRVETLVNGNKVQRSSTGELIFKVNEIVSFVSRVMTLLPGDVIATGTPPGVGPLRSGDRVEVRIEKIGTLANTVK